MKSTRPAIQLNVNPIGVTQNKVKCGELLRNSGPCRYSANQSYAGGTCLIVGVGVGVPPAKVRSQVQCFRGGVLQVELLGIGKAVTLTCSDGYICTQLSHQCR